MNNREAKEYLAEMREEFPCGTGGWKALGMAIKALEQTEWTPVSKQEPTKAPHILVSTVDDVVCEVDYGVLKHDASMNTLAKEFLESIVAWRPMPESYKEEV